MARAGGKDATRLDEALEAARSALAAPPSGEGRSRSTTAGAHRGRRQRPERHARAAARDRREGRARGGHGRAARDRRARGARADRGRACRSRRPGERGRAGRGDPRRSSADCGAEVAIPIDLEDERFTTSIAAEPPAAYDIPLPPGTHDERRSAARSAATRRRAGGGGAPPELPGRPWGRSVGGAAAWSAALASWSSARRRGLRPADRDRIFGGPSEPGAAVKVRIPEGSSVEDIGDILDDAGVVDSGDAVRARRASARRRRRLPPGTYTLRDERALRHHPPTLARARVGAGRDAPDPRGLTRCATSRRGSRRAGIYGEGLHERAQGRQPAGRLPRDRQRAPRSGGLPLPGHLHAARSRSPPRALVQQQLAAYERAAAKVDFRAGEEEPDALRRADHRLDDRARGGVPGRSRQDRRRDLQPPRADMPLGIDATIQYGVRLLAPLTAARPRASRAATTRARTGGCRRRRSATPAWPRCARPRSRRSSRTSTTSRSRATRSAGTSSPRTTTSSCSSRRTTRRRTPARRRPARRRTALPRGRRPTRQCSDRGDDAPGRPDRRPGVALAVAAHAERRLPGRRAGLGVRAPARRCEPARRGARRARRALVRGRQRDHPAQGRRRRPRSTA